MRNCDRRILAVLALAGALLWSVGNTAAQDPPPGPPSETRPGPGFRHGRPPGTQPGGPPGHGRFGRHGFAGPGFPFGPFGQDWVRITAEDRGPLQPGEEDALLAFAREHMPRMADLLTKLQAREPEKFRERLTQMAPYLRHLRRVFDANKRLGELMKKCAENFVEMERLARAAREATAGTPDAEQKRQLLRAQVAANFDVEAELFGVIADQIESERKSIVDSQMEDLLADQADLSILPPPVRELIENVRAATTDEEREKARTALRQSIDQRVSDDIARRRGAAQRIRENKVNEVDRRVERLLSDHAREDGPPGKPRPPGPGGG
jgi:hypothetical protein